MSSSKQTTDHDEIRRWIEARDGVPAAVRATERKDDPGLLRVRFDNDQSDQLDELSWDDFFAKFDQAKLAFLYQDKTADGGVSRFFKFVERS